MVCDVVGTCEVLSVELMFVAGLVVVDGCGCGGSSFSVTFSAPARLGLVLARATCRRLRPPSPAWGVAGFVGRPGAASHSYL